MSITPLSPRRWGRSPLPSAGGVCLPWVPLPLSGCPWSWSQPGRASAQEPKMPLVPRARLTYLGFFSFFTSYSLVGSRLGEEWRAPLNFPVTQHHCQPGSDVYLRWIKLTCHHQLNVSVSKFSFCDVPCLYIWDGQVTSKKTLFRGIK